jgi:hypothetical protein
MRNHPRDEAHVARCADCQARWGLAALDVDLDRVWSGVAAEAWASPVGRVERLAGRLLGSPGLARALVNTPSLVLSWVLASALVLGIGVMVTRQTEQPWVALLAPALAGIAISYAYGPGVDPAWELSQTMAVSDRQVLLVRVFAVFGLNMVLGLVASLGAAQAVGITLGWLAPMAMVSALALAAATTAKSANVGVAIGLAGWAIAVLASGRGTEDVAAAVSRPALVPVYLAFALAGVGVTLWSLHGSSSAGGITWR